MNEEQTVRGGLKLAMHEHTTAQRAKAGLKKIRTQFTNDPDGKLMYAVVSQAVYDAVAAEPRVKYLKDHNKHLHWDINRTTAINYLRSDMPHAVDVGVDPEWIRRVFKSLGIDLRCLNKQHEEEAE